MPVNETDTVSHGVLVNPRPLQAVARHEHIRATLVDWQQFQSRAGAGLPHFRREKPRRPPSCAKSGWQTPMHSLHKCRTKATNSTLFARSRKLFRYGPFQMPLAYRRPVARTSCPMAITYSMRSDTAPISSLRAHHTSVSLGMGECTCAREALTDEGFGAQTWMAADRGDITLEQASLVVVCGSRYDSTRSARHHPILMAANPAKRQRIRRDPGLAGLAFDEAMRWQSRVQTFFRTRTTDIQVGDHVLPEGEKILILLGAANRDPRRCANPNAFNLSTDPSGHVGFGMGIHQCVGHHIARLEAEVLLTTLARRIDRLELSGRTRRHHNNTLRGWARIPVRVRRAAG